MTDNQLAFAKKLNAAGYSLFSADEILAAQLLRHAEWWRAEPGNDMWSLEACNYLESYYGVVSATWWNNSATIIDDTVFLVLLERELLLTDGRGPVKFEPY